MSLDTGTVKAQFLPIDIHAQFIHIDDLLPMPSSPYELYHTRIMSFDGENMLREDDSVENQKIDLWIKKNKDQLIEDIVDLVDIPSVSVETEDSKQPFGEPCLRVLEKALEIGHRMGFEGKNHENYCGTLLWKGETDSEIGIFAHLDVVPEGTGWKYKPYQAVVKDNCIIGRGTADNKGSSMASLYALYYLKEAEWKPRHSIRMFFGCNEECVMHDLQYYVKNNPMPAFSIIPDAAFPVCYGEKGIMEIDADYDLISSNLIEFCSGIASNSVPSDAYAIINESENTIRESLKDEDINPIKSCGKGAYKISVKGIAAHAAFPEGSDSAEVKLANILKKSGLLDEKAQKLMEAIHALFQDYYGAGIRVPYADEISGKLTHIGGFTWTCDHVFHQSINIRYPITADREKMAGEIATALNEQGFTIREMKDSAPSYVDKNNSVIKELTDICNRHLGLSLEPYVMGGGTYARKLKNAVGYGPGTPDSGGKFGSDRGSGHQPDEYIEVGQLETAIRIYADAVKAIDMTI